MSGATLALLAAVVAGAAALRRPDARSFHTVASAVAGWTPFSGVSPWELSNLDDGDIMLPPGARLLYSDRTWPNRTVPFVLERTYFRGEEIEAILGVIQKLNELSCLELWEAESHTRDFVRITGEARGCYSEQYGRKGGVQTLNLQPPACLEPGTIYHQLMHAAGFRHMHNAPDRDQYIRVLMENVEEGREKHFHKYNTSDNILGIGQHYDYDSIMHFSRRAYSKDGSETIETKNSPLAAAKEVLDNSSRMQRWRSVTRLCLRGAMGDQSNNPPRNSPQQPEGSIQMVSLP